MSLNRVEPKGKGNGPKPAVGNLFKMQDPKTGEYLTCRITAVRDEGTAWDVDFEEVDRRREYESFTDEVLRGLKTGERSPRVQNIMDKMRGIVPPDKEWT